jgi:hypothetical protein
MEELGVMAGPPLNVGTFRRQQSHLPVKSSAAFLPLISPEVRLSSFPSDHGHGAEKNVLTFAH